MNRQGASGAAASLSLEQVPAYDMDGVYTVELSPECQVCAGKQTAMLSSMPMRRGPFAEWPDHRVEYFFSVRLFSIERSLEAIYYTAQPPNASRDQADR